MLKSEIKVKKQIGTSRLEEINSQEIYSTIILDTQTSQTNTPIVLC